MALSLPAPRSCVSHCSLPRSLRETVMNPPLYRRPTLPATPNPPGALAPREVNQNVPRTRVRRPGPEGRIGCREGEPVFEHVRLSYTVLMPVGGACSGGRLVRRPSFCPTVRDGRSALVRVGTLRGLGGPLSARRSLSRSASGDSINGHGSIPTSQASIANSSGHRVSCEHRASHSHHARRLPLACIRTGGPRLGEGVENEESPGTSSNSYREKVRSLMAGRSLPVTGLARETWRPKERKFHRELPHDRRVLV